MTTDRSIYSDLAIPPGEYLLEVIESREITQADLARRMGRPTQAINEIVKGEKAITSETALQLEQVLGTPAHIWTGLEAEFQLVLARQKENSQLAREAEIVKQLSYPHLVKMGAVRVARDMADKIDQVKRLFGVAALENMPQVKAYAPAFRVAEKKSASPYALAAWLRCGELRAKGMETAPFSKEKLRLTLGDIRRMTNDRPETFQPRLVKILADCGVALVILPHLPKTYAHGATFWLAPDKAVVMMSIRGSWADIFWFSLFHELAHILLHDNRSTFIEGGSQLEAYKAREAEANRFAEDFLIPPAAYDELKGQSSIGPTAVQAFAGKIEVDRGIVVGRLAHDKALLPGTVLNKLRTRFVWSATKE
jgi:HTH-type transcriptional regulator/antitoxin HigA